MRVALYYAPRAHDPLHRAGAAWLGRDPESGATVPHPAFPDIDPALLHAATAAPRHYGLHATLTPPRRLATGWEEFAAAAAALADRTPAFPLPTLHLAEMSGCLALAAPACPPLDALAEACVRAADVHLRRPDDAERARRRAGGLDDEQERLLQRWGYPHVLSRWRFHITLTGRLDPAAMPGLRDAAARHFADALAAPRAVTEICIVTEAAAGTPMLIAERLALRT
ncbi:MAG: DUF1045 domain-containing protein [Janthinobacterium lividum]